MENSPDDINTESLAWFKDWIKSSPRSARPHPVPWQFADAVSDDGGKPQAEAPGQGAGDGERPPGEGLR